jgi:hypothetical protein
MAQNQPTLNNPYLPDATDESADFVPFVGRQRAFEHIYQRLTEPQSAGVSVLLGRRDIGKTVFLKHFHDYFDDSFVNVYLPLKTYAPQNESEWLSTLALETMQVLARLDFSMYRLPKLGPESGSLREWLVGYYLPDVFSMIRYRRMVWLMDDADMLLDWVRRGRLPSDTFTYLSDLVTQQPSLGIVVTMDEGLETELPRMNPLAELSDVFRLTNLKPEETAALMQKPVEGLYRIGDDVAEVVYRATGGQPRLVQRFGSQLYQRWEASPKTNVFTAEEVKAVSATVYSQSKDEFQHLWSGLDRDEQRVIAAVAQLIYADPLTAVNARSIERWLVESDYPMDMTAVYSALRGLEYKQLIENTSGGIRVAANLLQIWFLENAHLPEVKATASLRTQQPWRLLAVALIFIALLVLLVVVAGQQNASRQIDNALPQPTVTLISGS